MLYLECPKEIAKQRFLARDLPDRPRQNEGTFEKRYEQFEDLNPLIVEAYEELPDGLVKVCHTAPFLCGSQVGYAMR